MRIPTIRGIIDRRILVNFRVDADVLGQILPKPFRPQLVDGNCGMAGVCLIRLKQVRPPFLPAFLGISSENAAHRIAVQWEQDGQLHHGVYIPRRDTSSRLAALVGGRLFPGVHHHARFDVEEHDGYYRVALDSDDGDTHLTVAGRIAAELPPSSVFRTLSQASTFFERGSLGYSSTKNTGEFDGLELRTFDWRVQPLAVETVESSFFDDTQLFPSGSVAFDCALLMQEVEHQWHKRPSLGIEGAAA